MDHAKQLLLSRRAFNARIAAATGAIAAPLHVLGATAADESLRVMRLAESHLDAYWRLYPVDATENTGDARYERVLRMVEVMEQYFGSCTMFRECEAVCPKEISIDFIARLNGDYIASRFKSRKALAR